MQRYDYDVTPINVTPPGGMTVGGGAMMPYQQQATPIAMQQMPVQQVAYNATHPRQTMPVFTVSPSDFLGGMVAIRAYLSCLRHRPVMTTGWSLFSFWVLGFGMAAGFNLLRPDTKTADCVFVGCLANPISAGTNLSALIKGAAIAPASSYMGDVLLEQNGSIKRTTVQQARPTVEAQ